MIFKIVIILKFFYLGNGDEQEEILLDRKYFSFIRLDAQDMDFTPIYIGFKNINNDSKT